MNKNKQRINTKADKPASISQYDKSWADLNKGQSNKIIPRHICVLNKPGYFTHIAKSVHLYLTTRYSWSTSWQQAVR